MDVDDSLNMNFSADADVGRRDVGDADVGDLDSEGTRRVVFLYKLSIG